MKKLFILLLIFCLSVSALPVCAQEPVITVVVNGKVLETDVAPKLVNNRTMLPMRAIFESLGAKVTWVDTDQLIFATKDDCLVVLSIGYDKMSVQKSNSVATSSVHLDTAPFIFNSRTLVPVRAVAEALEADVLWDGDTYTVTVTTK